MVIFVAIAVVLVLATLLGVLWPLWQQSRGLVLACVLALGATVFALYHMVGTPQAIGLAALAPPATPQTMQEAVTRLEAELVRDPAQPEGWRLLGKSYAMLDRLPEARDAYARAAKLLPDDPDVLVETAQARLFADPQRMLDAQSVAMLQHALELQPQHQRARWLLGVWHRQNNRAADAASTWEPLLAQVDAKTAATLRVQVDAARKDAGLAPLPAAITAVAAAPAVDTPGNPSANALTVNVTLDPDFASRVRLRGDASVFVIARIPNGPPMPVAAQKHALSELPLTITLDDNDSPMPTQKLSALKDVEVFARISATGDAMRQEGDIDSKPVRVTLPTKLPVELVIGAAD